MYTCIQCGYGTKIKCNYIRHLNKKIKCDTNVSKITQNASIDTQNASIDTQNASIDTQKASIDTQKASIINQTLSKYEVITDNIVKCKACTKILTKNNFNRHLKVCKQVPSNTCVFCEKNFNSSSVLCKHKKTCKLNPVNMDIKVQCNEGASSSNISTQIVNNYYVNTVNNNTVNNNNTVHNNTVNNNNTITFTSFGRENLEHLTSQVMIDPRLNNIRKCYRDTVDLSHFNADHPENHTIRKTNLKSNLIEFKTHQNKWEYESDKAGFRKIRKNLEEKFKTKFDDVDDMTLTAFNEMLYRQTQRGPVPEDEILNKYKSVKYVEAMCDAQVEKQRIKYLDEMELPHEHNIPIYGNQELREKENDLRKTYGLPLKPEIEFVSCAKRWRDA